MMSGFVCTRILNQGEETELTPAAYANTYVGGTNAAAPGPPYQLNPPLIPSYLVGVLEWLYGRDAWGQSGVRRVWGDRRGAGQQKTFQDRDWWACVCVIIVLSLDHST